MNRSDLPDDLDRLLRDAAPLPDDGFSQRVLAALPPRRVRDFSGLRRLVLCLAGAAVGLWLSRNNGSLPAAPSLAETAGALAGQVARLAANAESIRAFFAAEGPTVFSLAVALGAAIFALVSSARDSLPPPLTRPTAP